MLRALFAFALVLALGQTASADDSREGYYYPPVGTEEVFERQLGGVPPTGRKVRVSFVTQLTKSQMAAPEAPRFAVFAKGKAAQHMIIVALDDGIFKTLYRARGVLAQLTSNARSTEFFQRNNIADTATWFDLLKLLGFEDLIISDGETWSHRVKFR